MSSRPGVGDRGRAGEPRSRSSRRCPFLDNDRIVGAFWTPSVGVVDSLRAGTLMRETAIGAGRPDGRADRRGHRPRRRATARSGGSAPTGGDIESDTVVVACGVWSPKIAAMAGAAIPLTPAVHQMIRVGPVPQLAEREGEISFPIIRDMDTLLLRAPARRRHGGRLLRPPRDPARPRARSRRSSRRSSRPTEMPFTEDDFDPQLEQALELMPEALGAEGAEIRYAINGLLSLTPDGAPMLGETPEVDGLWSAAAVWIKEGPGVGRARGRVDDRRVLRDRPPPHRHRALLRAPAHPRARPRAHRRGVQQDLRHRPPRRAVGVRPRQAARADARRRAGGGRGLLRGGRLGATDVVRRPTSRCSPTTATPSCRASTSGTAAGGRPIINAEHLAMRERAGIVDLSAFAIFDVVGPGARDVVQRIVVAQADVGRRAGGLHPGARRPGRLPLRPHGDAAGPRPATASSPAARTAWPTSSGSPTTCPPTATPQVVDLTSAYTTIGLWGPAGPRHPRRADRRRHQPRRLRVPDLPRHRDRQHLACSPRGSPTSASWAGSSTSRWSRGPGLWRLLHEAGRPHGAVPVGIGVYGTTGRLEKGYRAFGFELDAERTIVEAGMQRPKVKAADFVGREAYLEQREAAPKAVLCTLTVDNHTSASRGAALHARRRADPDPRRRRAHRRARPPPLRHLGRLGTVARRARAAGVPAAGPGRASATSSRCPTWRSSTRSRSGPSTPPPLFDPANDRIKG